MAQKTDFSGLARPSAQSSGGRHPAARPPINLSRAALSIAPAIWGQKQFRKFSRNLSAENRVNRAVLENDGDLGPGPSGSENRNLAEPRNHTQVVPARVQHVPPSSGSTAPVRDIAQGRSRRPQLPAQQSMGPREENWGQARGKRTGLRSAAYFDSGQPSSSAQSTAPRCTQHDPEDFTSFDRRMARGTGQQESRCDWMTAPKSGAYDFLAVSGPSEGPLRWTTRKFFENCSRWQNQHVRSWINF